VFAEFPLRSALLVKQNVAVKRLESDLPLDWVREAATNGGTNHGGVTGYKVDIWPASIWILHNLYERPGKDSDKPSDNVETFGIDDGGVATGHHKEEAIGDFRIVAGQMGRSEDPGPPWLRVRWSELALRVPTAQRSIVLNPSFQWMPEKEWPTRIRRPTEGSLDREKRVRLVEILTQQSSEGDSTRCVCFFATFATREWDFDHPFRVEVELKEVLHLYDNEEVIGSPSNFWPEDRAWFVYSDHDLKASKVSGSEALIQAIVEDTQLETLSRP
jgi:hypothetical protein